MLQKILKDFQSLSNPSKAKLLSRYFKTGKGEYADGDVFIGIMVPQLRKLVAKYKDMPLADVEEMLHSKVHEHKFTALQILVEKYKHNKDQIFNMYLNNTHFINNWDLIDLTAPKIVGDYLLNKDRNILYKLAKSHHLWEKRIAILSTFMFIKHNQFKDTLNIATILLKDKHDLIHKAVGWALREVGKKDQKLEEQFLKKHKKEMPRTMLRYAIEKFSKQKKQFYMSK